MPELDTLVADRPPADEPLVEGRLTVKSGERYARVDGQPALWGPLHGADHLAEGATLVLGRVQDGTPYVVWPQTGAGGSSGGGDGGGAFYSLPIGDGSATAFTVPHNLGTRAVGVAVYRSSAPYDEVFAEVERTDNNTVTVRTQAPPTGGEYTVVVSGPGAAGGGGGAPATYVHDQATPSPTWVITHNRGGYPSATVIDTGGSNVWPDVHYDNADTMRLLFGSATAGKAYLN